MGFLKGEITFSDLSLLNLKEFIRPQINYSYNEKEIDDEFCGIYFHGYDSPFTLSEHELPIKCFRFFSKKSYPIFLFCYQQSEDLTKLLKLYENIIVVQLDQPMKSINDYDEFVIYKLFQWIPKRYNKTLTFHSDGFLINHGWEEFVNYHDFDYIGAPWCNFCGEDGDVVLPEYKDLYSIQTKTAVGNGGFCYRKRDKCLEVVNAIQKYHLNWKYTGSNLPDDVFFSYFGFGMNFFKNYDISLSYKWSKEPIDSLDTFGFHCTSKLIKEKHLKKNISFV